MLDDYSRLTSKPQVKSTPNLQHLRGEFVESNLGAAEGPAGLLTVRMIAQQFVFVPQCIVVPARVFPSRFELPAPIPCTC